MFASYVPIVPDVVFMGGEVMFTTKEKMRK